MRSAAVFGFRLSWAAITVGAVGAAGAVVAIVDPG
jgi:hypothetical protein